MAADLSDSLRSPPEGASASTPRRGRDYYAWVSWDQASWVEIISIEYESLILGYPFDRVLSQASQEGRLKLLDVGCGTGIFPSYLDQALPTGLSISGDLLDISAPSLDRATAVIAGLEHFSVDRTYECLIEDVPERFGGVARAYDVIWAMHSFTTVDVARMPAVLARLLDLLAPGGLLFIYQLTAASSYQRLHAHYRAHSRQGESAPAYMEFEDTREILDKLGAEYEVREFSFDHHIPADRSDLLEFYLRKVILDDGAEVLAIFEDVLPEYQDQARGRYAFPQSVHLAVAHSTARPPRSAAATLSGQRSGGDRRRVERAGWQDAGWLKPLPDDYYAECNAVFRKATNQADSMLEQVQQMCRGRRDMSVLSIGSGTGLFEVPMLEVLVQEVGVRSFTGIDRSEPACGVLRQRLSQAFGSGLDYQVVHESFEAFAPGRRYDLVLFNHVLEYLRGDHLAWVRKSLDLVSRNGFVLIFSPDRGGINRAYELSRQAIEGSPPLFSDELHGLLTVAGIPVDSQHIPAECDISLLDGPDDNEDKVRLLSFLTQIDCRAVPADQRAQFAAYFRSLRSIDNNLIPHPTTMFWLAP